RPPSRCWRSTSTPSAADARSLRGAMDAQLKAKDDDAVSLKAQKAALPLYATRIKVYPRAVSGRWRTVKWSVLVLLLGSYYAVPWLRWERGPGAPSQAILIRLHRQW